MAKKGTKAGDTTAYLILGGIFGVVIDMFYGSTGLPGYNDQLRTCRRITMGDLLQLGAESVILLGSLYTNSEHMKTFSAGMLFGGLAPKLNALNGARYFVFDLDPDTGAIVPVGRVTE